MIRTCFSWSLKEISIYGLAFLVKNVVCSFLVIPITTLIVAMEGNKKRTYAFVALVPVPSRHRIPYVDALMVCAVIAVSSTAWILTWIRNAICVLNVGTPLAMLCGIITTIATTKVLTEFKFQQYGKNLMVAAITSMRLISTDSLFHCRHPVKKRQMKEKSSSY